MRPPFLIALFGALASSLFGQGSLTPPAGTPAPTMKTLDQVEPRTPISSLPFNITTPGSYYLTKSLAATGDAITISSDDVTLDLMGFTLTGEGAEAEGGGAGVIVGSAEGSGRQRVIVRNGTTRNFFAGVGIYTPSSHILLEDLLTEANSAGIFVTATASGQSRDVIVRRCRAVSNISFGVLIATAAGHPATQNVIEDCQALNNETGFRVAAAGCLIVRNIASGNTLNDYRIAPDNRMGAIITPTPNASEVTTSGGGTGTSDPFANLRY